MAKKKALGMDEYILKLRGFDLRWMLLIMMVSCLAILLIFFNNDYNMGVGCGITALIIGVYFITLVVHSIDRDDVALIVSKIGLGLCAVGFIASIMVYGDMPTVSKIDGFDFLFGKSEFEVWSENLTIQSAPYTAISGVLGIIACWYLLRYINKIYRGVWIMMICILVVSTLSASILALSGPDGLVIHKVILVLALPLSFIQLGMTIFAANKEKKRVPVVQSTSQPSQKAEPQLGKTEQLFKLKELLDGGILTQEEFDNEKKKILNS